MVEMRAALARGPSRTTSWVQLRVEPGADELLWVLPVPAGTSVDLASTSFLDALEQSTAPHVLPPAGSAPQGQTCSKPSVAVISGGDASPVGGLAGQDVFSDVGSLVAKVTSLGYDASRLDQAALTTTTSAGGRLLALRLTPTLTAVDTETTVTVRTQGPQGGLEALPLLKSGATAVPVTLWLIGDGRAYAQGASELLIDPTKLRWTDLTTTNYLTVRDGLLTSAPASFVVEVAGPRPLHDVVSLPGGSLIPPLVDAYARRVFERGEASGDLGAFSDQARTTASSASVSEPCARGDLLAAEPGCQPGTDTSSDKLMASSKADDLAFVFAGQAGSRWVTRLTGLQPAGQAPAPVVASFTGTDTVSLLYTPSSDWTSLCQPTSSTGGGAGGKPGGYAGSNGSQGQGTGAYGTSPGSGTGDDDDDTLDSVQGASTGVSCAAAFGDAMCSTATTGSGQNESCDCGSSGSSDESDSSCSKGDDDSSSEGCGCGDSSGSSGDDDGACSSSSQSGSDCSGSSTSSGGDSCGKCSTGRGRRAPPRLSKWLMVLTALALPVRRRTRPRRQTITG